MDELLRHLTPDLFLSLPGFRLLALCTLLLVLKMHAVGIWTGVVRSRRGLRTNPEDAQKYGGQAASAEHPDVERGLRAHRNDVENIPPFLLLAFAAVLAGAAPDAVRVCVVAFTAARFVHSLAYLRSVQPWRSLSWGVGLLATLVLCGLLVARLLA
ncbi:MAPEG family protein [Aggregicoccus sp. 17bor-14]|uniref:MAPEG family protein n=1 Tax=Myxococcaceae TaxID=31 RepID=UPI00129C616C|nr:MULTISPECIES: MAPEG family protein [Myxococcaceae]MBF5045197.1 MAPEG family protein [Simulacricoccus sp. 17bor-14]MRI90938.1 MAPEG family protein [Aggregicoccus sp. 17bor-14]